MPSKVRRIVSGGQTGADRAALDFAIENDIDYGGFVPRGRLAEDGEIPSRYAHLTEAATSDPAERTRLNVLSSDGTILITHGPPVGGSGQTKEFAHSLGKPLLHIDLANESIALFSKTLRSRVPVALCRATEITRDSKRIAYHLGSRLPL